MVGGGKNRERPAVLTCLYEANGGKQIFVEACLMREKGGEVSYIATEAQERERVRALSQKPDAAGPLFRSEIPHPDFACDFAPDFAPDFACDFGDVRKPKIDHGCCYTGSNTADKDGQHRCRIDDVVPCIPWRGKVTDQNNEIHEDADKLDPTWR